MKTNLEKAILEEYYESLKKINFPYKDEDMKEIIHNVALVHIIKMAFINFALTAIALFIILSAGIARDKIAVVIVSVLFIVANFISLFAACRDEECVIPSRCFSIPKEIKSDFFIDTSYHFGAPFILEMIVMLYPTMSIVVCLNTKHIVSFLIFITKWITSFNSASVVLLTTIGAACVGFLILYFYKRNHLSDLLKNKIED